MIEAKRVILSIIITGIVAGGCLAFGLYEWNNASAHRFMFHEEFVLEQENAFLQHHVRGVTRSLDAMDHQLMELYHYDSRLHILALEPLTIADSLARINVFREAAYAVRYNSLQR